MECSRGTGVLQQGTGGIQQGMGGRGATSTLARGGHNYNFVIVWGGGFKGGFPPFSKKFSK